MANNAAYDMLTASSESEAATKDFCKNAHSQDPLQEVAPGSKRHGIRCAGAVVLMLSVGMLGMFVAGKVHGPAYNKPGIFVRDTRLADLIVLDAMRWEEVVSPFPIQDCALIKDDTGTALPPQKVDALLRNRWNWCMQVFGVLIVGTTNADPNAMRYGANILAQILDLDCDGQADDTNIQSALNSFTDMNAPFLSFGKSSHEEHGPCWERGFFDFTFSSQTWKAWEKDYIPQIVLEETFHMVHQMAWAKVYPDIFGYRREDNTWPQFEDQTLACQCMMEAQCKWYHHPENYGCRDKETGELCPNMMVPNSWKDKLDSSVVPGTCLSEEGCGYPSCDCIEFFHKVDVIWVENANVAYRRFGNALDTLVSQGMTQKEAVEAILKRSPSCRKLLAAMESDKYKLPKRSITATYTCRAPIVQDIPKPRASLWLWTVQWWTSSKKRLLCGR